MQIYFGRPVPLSFPIKHSLLALKFTAILLVQWILWSVSAIADALDDYTGYEYQSKVVVILSFTIAFMFIVPSALYSAQVVTFWWSVMVGISLYLFFGVCYFLHERSWD